MINFNHIDNSNVNTILLIKEIIMKKINFNFLKLLFYGFLVWLIPFITSVFFYTQEGELRTDIFLFKTIMIVVGAILGAFLLISYFKKIENNFLREGIIVGIVWFGLNIVLDLVILKPISGMTIPVYFMQVGLRYLSIPAMSIAVGAALANKK